VKNYKQKIISILKRFEIPYWTEGKNVSVDSVNIQCPFCSDHSNHCGIFQDTLVFHCWRCNTKGPFERLLAKLTSFTEDECKDIIDNFDVTFKESTVEQIIEILNKEKNVEKSQKTKVELPKFFERVTYDIDFPLLFKYLERREIDLDTVVKMKCGVCLAGQYMNRLIIPIYQGEDLVAFQAADLTGRAQVKYRTGPKGVQINNYLYNYDSIEGRMIITEGVLDVWRVGSCAVATFGTHLTEKQKKLILDKKLNHLIFLWDGDAYWKARRAADFFKPFVEKVDVIMLPKGEDPDSAGTERVWKLIEEERV